MNRCSSELRPRDPTLRGTSSPAQTPQRNGRSRQQPETVCVGRPRWSPDPEEVLCPQSGDPGSVERFL